MSFAIITFRATGPIKTWSELRAAQSHNLREKQIAHAVDPSAEPIVLLGTNDLVNDVRTKLIEHNIDPANLRENGVLAYEAVLTASPSFFAKGTDAERADRLARWAAAQKKFVLERFRDRAASLILHGDEQTPHAHLMLVPLELVDDKRRKDRGWRYSLVGASISGPGRFDQLQDQYAEAMAPFGLKRGERGSGRKNEPYQEMAARMTEREVLARNAEAASEQQRRIWLKMSQSGAEQLAILDLKIAEASDAIANAEQERRRAAEDIRKASEQAAAAEAARRRIIERSNELLKGWEDLAQEERDLAKDRAEVRREKAMIAEVAARATAFAQAFEAVDPATLPPSIITVLQAAKALIVGPSAMPTSRYDATASARSVPLPVRQAAGMGI